MFFQIVILAGCLFSILFALCLPAQAVSFRRFALYREGGVEVLCDSYTVAPGDFVLEIMRLRGQIAYRQFGEFMEIFRRLNPEVTAISKIYPGQTIIIPIKKAPTGTFKTDDDGSVTLAFASVTGSGEPGQPSAAAARALRVRRGDSVSGMIAKQFGPVGSAGYQEGMAKFKELNPTVSDVNFIYAGEELLIPSADGEKAKDREATPSASGPGSRTVKPGDTVARFLSSAYGKPGSKAYEKGLAEFKNINPHIKNVNRIFPGTVVKLPGGKPLEKQMAAETRSPAPPKNAQETAALPEGQTAAITASATAEGSTNTASANLAQAPAQAAGVTSGEARKKPEIRPAPPALAAISPAVGETEPAPPKLIDVAPVAAPAESAPPAVSRVAPAVVPAEQAPPSVIRVAPLAAEAAKQTPAAKTVPVAAKAAPLPKAAPAPPGLAVITQSQGVTEAAPPAISRVVPVAAPAESAPPAVSRVAPAVVPAEPAPPSVSRVSPLAVEAAKPAPAAKTAPVPAKAVPLPKASPAPPGLAVVTQSQGVTEAAPPAISRVAPAVVPAESAPPQVSWVAPVAIPAQAAPPSVSRVSPLAVETAKPAPAAKEAVAAYRNTPSMKSGTASPQIRQEAAQAPPIIMPTRVAASPAVQAAGQKAETGIQARVLPAIKKPGDPSVAGKPAEPEKPAPAPAKPAPPKKPELVGGTGKGRHPELGSLLKPFGINFLNSGEYRFPGPGDAEFRLDLERNPVAELPGGERLLVCRGESLSQSESAAVLSYWRNARIVTVGASASPKAMFGAVLEEAGIDSVKETVFSDGGATVTVRGDFIVPLGRGGGFEVIAWLSPPSARTSPSFLKYLESRKYHLRETGVPAVRGIDGSSGKKAQVVAFSGASRRDLAARLLGMAGVRYAKDVPVSFSYAGFDVNITADMAKTSDGREYIVDYGSIYGDTEKELNRMGLSVIPLGKRGGPEAMVEALWKALALEYRKDPVFSGADRSREPVSSVGIPGYFAVLPGGASVLATRFNPSKALAEFLGEKGVAVFVMPSSGPFE